MRAEKTKKICFKIFSEKNFTKIEKFSTCQLFHPSYVHSDLLENLPDILMPVSIKSPVKKMQFRVGTFWSRALFLAVRAPILPRGRHMTHIRTKKTHSLLILAINWHRNKELFTSLKVGFRFFLITIIVRKPVETRSRIVYLDEQMKSDIFL